MAGLDLSSLVGMLAGDGVSALSNSVKAEESQVSNLIGAALPTLIGNLKDNASTEEGAKSLTKALKDHSSDDTSDVASFLKNADLKDGASILKHIFGDEEAVKKETKTLAKSSGLTSSQASTVLNSIAPLLLSTLGTNLLGKSTSKSSSSSGLSGLLGSVLGSGNVDLTGILSGVTNLASEAKETNKSSSKKSTSKTTSKKSASKTTSKKTTSKTTSKKTTSKTTGKAASKKEESEDSSLLGDIAGAIVKNLLD
ncbi:MAG: DUF937 domain-containing protein [Lachnospiraceae bacterium]|jgi:hypothetical protein